MENIDTLIINRLGEHQRKVDFINCYFNRRSNTMMSFKKISYSLLSIAACLAIVAFISPILFNSDNFSNLKIPMPSFQEYRGTTFRNIELHINNEQYEDALSSINLELIDVESELRDISSIEMSEDEEAYLTSLYRGEQEELIWSKIYVLAKLGKKNQLKDTCIKYLHNNDFRQYKSDVENILSKIQ